MSDDPDLKRAYGLRTANDSVQLYGAWADSYDKDFAAANGYVLHEAVARYFVMTGGFGPVLDVGAGTGLCGCALAARGIDPVDGTDISQAMLDKAREKDTYRNLFAGNLLDGLALPHGPYQGAVSAGTFTRGHVGPEGIHPVLNAVRSGGWIVLSVNKQHYGAAGFAQKMDDIAGQITDLSTTKADIYAPDATGANARDTALILAFRKA